MLLLDKWNVLVLEKIDECTIYIDILDCIIHCF